MRQLTQKLKNGSMQAVDVPTPKLRRGMVLVRNHYSLISAGTEGNTVLTARKNLIGKAQKRPDQVKQVFDALRTQGPVQTYRAVMKKLDAYSSLGYSCTGEIIDVGEGETDFSLGDWVACGGFTASHAELVAVPINLCAKLRPDSDLKQAAYNTLGAIAMQAVRQSDLRLAESCAVIGLGLLGQLTALLLRVSGVRVVGVDISRNMVQIAGSHCLDLAIERDSVGIEQRILEFTGGLGCDAVIITAATDSLDPINFAGAIARKRGTIVVVGAVPTGFDREPHYYKKELQVKMSCSYGPGRYDPLYEENGIDYPLAYVRWTEKRNMEAFQELIYSKKIDVSYLTTHSFKLEDAPKAYDMMMERKEPFIGVLIEYDVARPITRDEIVIGEAHGIRDSGQGVNIGFIGAGSYAQSYLLPNLPKRSGVVPKGVMTSSGNSSRSVAERFGFEFCTGDEEDILDNDSINTVFIATRHDSHAEYVLNALKAGNHVFVEKPLCLKIEQLDEINKIYSDLRSQTSNFPLLMVGYNRRFSPMAKVIKEEFGDGQMAMTYRINAGEIPANSWIQDVETGGGRIIGEVCHFIDFLTYMCGSSPISVYGAAMDDPNHLNDTLNVSLAYENGSIGAISYFANGSKGLPKERIEIYGHGCTAVLDDFKKLTIFAGGKKKERKLISQNKGQKAEVAAFIKAILDGKSSPISMEELYSTSLVTFKILESIRTGKSAKL